MGQHGRALKTFDKMCIHTMLADQPAAKLPCKLVVSIYGACMPQSGKLPTASNALHTKMRQDTCPISTQKTQGGPYSSSHRSGGTHAYAESLVQSQPVGPKPARNHFQASVHCSSTRPCLCICTARHTQVFVISYEVRCLHSPLRCHS